MYVRWWLHCCMSTILASQFATAVAALGAVSMDVADFQATDDTTLVSLSRLAAREKQLADAHLALIAGEIAARSTRDLGHAGLAQRSGFRNAEELLKVTTGASGREAVTAVRVGRLVREAAVAPDDVQEPWLAAVASAVAAGSLAVGAADAIRTGLGVPTENVSAEALSLAASELCALAATLDVDRLLKHARELRDDLDEVGIADRERERFEKRSLRHYLLPNGMGRVTWDLDPESYATVVELFDRATSPKRGVRFVSGDRKETADRIAADPRSIEQLASDTFLGLLQCGADADSTQMLGTGAAQIRVLVTKKTLNARKRRKRRRGFGCGRGAGSWSYRRQPHPGLTRDDRTSHLRWRRHRGHRRQFRATPRCRQRATILHPETAHRFGDP